VDLAAIPPPDHLHLPIGKLMAELVRILAAVERSAMTEGGIPRDFNAGPEALALFTVTRLWSNGEMAVLGLLPRPKMGRRRPREPQRIYDGPAAPCGSKVARGLPTMAGVSGGRTFTLPGSAGSPP
jgi:hypothetical protein